MHHAVHRAITALAATGVAVGLLAAPASAGAPTTRYVAPLPVTAASGGSCGSPDFSTIQAAVDASGRGDTVLVCPGTYRERVTVTTSRLTIRATGAWTATLQPPSIASARPAGARPAGARPAGADEAPLLTISGADGVTVQWLRMLAPATAGCSTIGVMLLVTDHALDTVIRANRIRPVGPQTWVCGYARGIRIDDGSSALVLYNLVSDFRNIGIMAAGTGTIADIVGNSVRFRHAGVADHGFTGFGINISEGADGRIRANALVGLDTAGITTPQLYAAIDLYQPAPGVVVRDNLVRRHYIGLYMGATVDARVVGNVFERATGFGIYNSGDSGNVFRGNDARGATDKDCLDSTTGGAPGAPSFGTQNTWIGNLGDDSAPAGLCVPPVP